MNVTDPQNVMRSDTATERGLSWSGVRRMHGAVPFSTQLNNSTS